MKQIFTIFVMLMTFVGCTTMSPEQQAAAALLVIQSYQEAGVDIVSLDDDELALLQASCLSAIILFPEQTSEIIAYCDVVKEVTE